MLSGEGRGGGRKERVRKVQWKGRIRLPDNSSELLTILTDLKAMARNCRDKLPPSTLV